MVSIGVSNVRAGAESLTFEKEDSGSASGRNINFSGRASRCQSRVSIESLLYLTMNFTWRT